VSIPDDRRLEIAAFRRRVIAAAVEADGGSVSEAIGEAAAEAWIDPAGRPIRKHERTLWRWLAAWRRGGLRALCPAERSDRGRSRAIPADLLERAAGLRREKPSRATRTIIDILVREKRALPGELARSTLDRHFEKLGISRRSLRQVARKVFRKIETARPFELVVGDFHHGPYVRTAADEARRALLLAFIDHWSRFAPEARYYLHEDYAALRFGFRRLVTAWGLPIRLYLDNGPSFHANRFHAACDVLGVDLVHSKPYQSEGRGVVERFNRTLLEQFESEVRGRDELPTLDELNAFLEAWLAERYHKDVHSEIDEAPADRFSRDAALRPVPEPALVDEWLRLRERRTVHRKWSTVAVETRRYLVDPALRGRRIDVLHDPFDRSYVLVVHDGRIVQRAFPQIPGVEPPEVPNPQTTGRHTDYLALLRADHEKRLQAELSSIRLRPILPTAELALPDLVARLERCRAASLSATERALASAFWRKFRPIDPAALSLLDHAERRLGSSLHLQLYLDALAAALVRSRTKSKGETKS
jgi:putative transposase